MALSASLLNVFMDDCQAKVFFYRVAGFSERPSLYLKNGNICHEVAAKFHPEKRDGDPEYATLEEGLEAYHREWNTFLRQNRQLIKSKELEKAGDIEKRGEEGIRNYHLETFSRNTARPFYIEQARQTKIAGLLVSYIIDQVRELDRDLIPLWRPDLDGDKGLNYWYTNHVPVDLKFGKRNEDFKGRNIEGNMVQVSMSSVQPKERRQCCIYTLGYMSIFKRRMPNGSYRYVKPLGFLFYYPYQQTAGFLVPRKADVDLTKSELRIMGKAFENDSFTRNLRKKECGWCSFRKDCRGDNDEHVETPLRELPSVIRGIPEWEFEMGIVREGTQTKMPF